MAVIQVIFMNVYVKGEHNAHETEDCQNKTGSKLKPRLRHMGWSGTDEKTHRCVHDCDTEMERLSSRDTDIELEHEP